MRFRVGLPQYTMHISQAGIETILFGNSSQNVQDLVYKSASFTLTLFSEHDSHYIFHESFKTLLSVMVFQSLIISPKIAQVLFSKKRLGKQEREKGST